MIPEKLRTLIELLTVKTLEKKAIWNKGSVDNQFKLSLSAGIAIATTQWEDNYQNSYWEVIVFNDQGIPIERFETNNDTSAQDFHLLQAFHKAANDQYYKVEETMDTLLTSVQSQEIIGQKDVTDYTQSANGDEDEDDGLPF